MFESSSIILLIKMFLIIHAFHIKSITIRREMRGIHVFGLVNVQRLGCSHSLSRNSFHFISSLSFISVRRLYVLCNYFKSYYFPFLCYSNKPVYTLLLFYIRVKNSIIANNFPPTEFNGKLENAITASLYNICR